MFVYLDSGVELQVMMVQKFRSRTMVVLYTVWLGNVIRHYEMIIGMELE